MSTQILAGSKGIYRTTGKGSDKHPFTVVEDTCSECEKIPVKFQHDARPKVLVYMALCTFTNDGLKTNDFQGK
jgi:hypothetical protein